MTRTIQDRDLMLWEAFANSGEFGYPDRANLIFHCLSDPGRRARVVQRAASKAAVEEEVVALSDADLAALLEGAAELR